MATYSSIRAWKISWTMEPGGLQSKEMQRVGLKRLSTHREGGKPSYCRRPTHPLTSNKMAKVQSVPLNPGKVFFFKFVQNSFLFTFT